MKSAALISWVLYLPLIGSILNALFGKAIIDRFGKAGKSLVGLVSSAVVLTAFGFGLMIAAQMWQADPDARTTIIQLFPWIELASISIPFELRVDALSMTMVLVITGIGGLIHVYASRYMFDDPDYPRFFTYLNLFVVMMLTLVLGNNLALLFIGWEGVGVCSYLLIGFWYKDVANSKAANKAFIVNRIGDVGLTLGMFWLVYLLAGTHTELMGGETRWLSYDVILPAANEIFARFPTETTWICILLFIGAMGKSAQFPLYVWLPDAMAGPTPVSALIHAATMVTSGVVLLNRMSPLFLLSHTAMTVVVITGALTALIGATVAFGQTDIKKVLAYSTVSQLGYMFIACGVGMFYAGMFHVITHAFFKALLFLGSGSVIYAMAHNQDMRNYGNLKKYMPVTFAVMAVGYLALAGVPFAFAGFWSKEAILGPAVNDEHTTLMAFGGLTWGAIAGWVGFLVAGMTAFYMTRLFFLTFMNKEERWRSLEPVHGHDHHHGHDHAHDHAHGHHGEDENDFFYSDEEYAAIAARTPEEHHHDLDSHHEPKETPVLMWAPLTLLALGSTGLLGWFLNENLQAWLYPHDHSEHHGAIGHTTLIIISTVMVVLGIGLGMMRYAKKLPASEGWDMKKWNPVQRLAGDQWKYDWLVSNFLALRVGKVIGDACAAFDRTVIDGIVNGFGWLSAAIGNTVRRIQTGYVRTYAAVTGLGVIALLGYLVYYIMQRGGVN